MQETIAEISNALKVLRKPDPWSDDIKASDDFLDQLFASYFEKLGLPNIMRKSDYHVLAAFVPKEKIDKDIVEKLDAIVHIAKQATPSSE
jgi:hypothetical protein